MTGPVGWLRRQRSDSPRAYSLENYESRFPNTGSMFLRTVKRSGVLPLAEQERRDPLGVVVMPWVSTPVPWYAVALAIGLSRRGREVVIVWDDTGFPERHLEAQNEAIGKVLDHVGRYLPVIRLSEEPPAPLATDDAALLDSMTQQNVTWISRGATSATEDEALTATVASSLGETLPRVRSLFGRLSLDCLLLPGGVYSTSGLFRAVAEEGGCRVATFDTDRHIGQLCVSGVAAQNADVPRAFELLVAAPEEERQAAIAIGRAEFESRQDSSDGYGFQTLPAGGTADELTGSILLPLNVEWDTAALGRHRHFANSVDWLTSTIGAILERDQGPVIVRQHPSERRKLQRSDLDVRAVLADRFGGDPRLHFIAAEDAVNSYDLLSSARLVLPYVSTIGIEAAAMGKPVLISGAGYYADLGMVWSASSREEYLELLGRGLTGELGLKPEQVERAWLCFYLTAVRNRIPTDFTPHPDDFRDWVRRDLTTVFDEVEVADILTAIDENVPVSWLRHRRLLPSAARS